MSAAKARPGQAASFAPISSSADIARPPPVFFWRAARAMYRSGPRCRALQLRAKRGPSRPIGAPPSSMTPSATISSRFVGGKAPPAGQSGGAAANNSGRSAGLGGPHVGGDVADPRALPAVPKARLAPNAKVRRRGAEPKQKPIGASSSTRRTRTPPRERGGTLRRPVPARPVSVGSAGSTTGTRIGRGCGASSQVVGGRGVPGPKTQIRRTRAMQPTPAAQAQAGRPAVGSIALGPGSVACATRLRQCGDLASAIHACGCAPLPPGG